MEPSHKKGEALIERRRLPRFCLKAPIQFRNLLKPQESFIGSLSKDISAEGIRFLTPNLLPKDGRLVLLLSLPGRLKPIRAIGRVIWVQRHRFGDRYDCGVCFVEILSEDKEVLAEVVEQGVVLPSRSSS